MELYRRNVKNNTWGIPWRPSGYECGGPGSVPGWGTENPTGRAAQPKNNNNNDNFGEDLVIWFPNSGMGGRKKLLRLGRRKTGCVVVNSLMSDGSSGSSWWGPCLLCTGQGNRRWGLSLHPSPIRQLLAAGI